MAAFINTNIASLNSQRNLNSSQTALTTSLQRLSSGLRINSAKDDAAGLAISERMTSQINGSDQAARNANDGISLAQTAEGDLAQIGTNLQRMRELAVQASNGTNSASDRAALNGEVQSLAAEIDRVAQNSSFNGVKLLDGSFSSQDFQIGANNTTNDRITIASISSARTSELGGVGTSFAASIKGQATTGAIAAGDVTLNGFQVGASQMGAAPGQSTGSASSIANAINAISADSGVTATANTNNVKGAVAATPAAVPADTFSINGVNVGAIASGTTGAGQGANVAAAINKISTQTGVTAKADATTGAVSLTAADGRDVNLALNGAATDPTDAASAKASFLANTGLTADKGSAVVAGAGVTANATGSAAAATASTIAAGALTVNGVAVGGLALEASAAAAAGTVAGNSSTITLSGMKAGTVLKLAISGSATVASATFTASGNAATDATALASIINTATAGTVTAAGGVLTVGASSTVGISLAGTANNAQDATTGKQTLDSILSGSSLVTGKQASGGAVGNGQAIAAALQTALTASGDTTSTITANASGAIVTTIGSGKTVSYGSGLTATSATAAATNQTTLQSQTGLTNAQLGIQASGTNTVNHGTVSLSSSSASGIVYGGSDLAKAGLAAAGGKVTATTTSSVSSLSSMDVLTSANAAKAISAIDGALATVGTSRASLGAYQNRFASVVSSLQTSSENLSASRSRIQDTDFAKETASLTRGQILQQAGTAMLAQANSLPNGVLALLRG
jgi:flagellin